MSDNICVIRYARGHKLQRLRRECIYSFGVEFRPNKFPNLFNHALMSLGPF